MASLTLPEENRREVGFDLVLVGGGLQNGLIALSALHNSPGCRIALIEAEPALAGNHTWCVHAEDVPDSARSWFEPLIVKRWPGYDVRFPGLSRTLHSPYAVVTSTHFARVVQSALEASVGCQVLTGKRAVRIDAAAIELDDGSVVRGKLVVDARGPDASAVGSRSGFQKFVGLELETERPHGVPRPLLMDATCSQQDGFRFFYVLPLAENRLLVEETRFSRSPALDVPAARAAVQAYAASLVSVTRCLREERGILPMPWADASVVRTSASPLCAGYRGGYFHPATGYSLPAALRVATLIGTHATRAVFGDEWRAFQRRHRAQVLYARQLNRLLFTGFAERDMWCVFERFYRLPEDLIARFYALSLSVPDRARVLLGRPPRGFSLSRALFAGAEP
jgi:lycopene beta-cyclase